MRRSAGSFLGVLLVGLVLSGCVAAPSTPTPTSAASPSPSPSPSPTADPTPEPVVDPLTTVASLIIDADSLALVDAQGVAVAEYGFLDDPAAVVASLTVVFDAPPTDTPYDGGNHNPPGVHHRWGDALEIDERHYDESRRAENGLGLDWPRFVAAFDAPTYDGVALTTPSGAVAGMAWPEYSAIGIGNPGWSCVGPLVDQSTITETESRGPHVFGVALGAWWTDRPESETVGWIAAPFAQADGCV